MAPDRLIKHGCTVMVLAVAVAEYCQADMELVKAGGLLHDIGRTRTHDLRHGVVGETIARSLSLPEPLALIIRKHMGAGILPEEAVKMGLPELDYLPSTLEEKIVCHADNLVGDAEYLTSQASYQDFLRKGLERAGERMLAMHQELSDRCGTDVDEIVLEIQERSHRGPCGRYLRMESKKWADGI
jgi:uncharacterized protein (TIGR00295 family)